MPSNSISLDVVLSTNLNAGLNSLQEVENIITVAKIKGILIDKEWIIDNNKKLLDESKLSGTKRMPINGRTLVINVMMLLIDAFWIEYKIELIIFNTKLKIIPTNKQKIDNFNTFGLIISVDRFKKVLKSINGKEHKPNIKIKNDTKIIEKYVDEINFFPFSKSFL